MSAFVQQQMHDRFPRGAAVTTQQLEVDPYPIYADLRGREPVSWVPALGMYYVTSEALVRQVLLDDGHFTTSSPDSLIHRAFGDNVLTVDGPLHARYRKPLQRAFLPAAIRGRVEVAIVEAVTRLIASFPKHEPVELRSAFASRLPVQTVLATVGLPLEDEPLLRGWYDRFELALANFAGDAAISAESDQALNELNVYFDAAIARARTCGDRTTLIGMLANDESEERFDDLAIRSNLAIVFFGGISTVEALILNAVWALAHHDHARQRAIADAGYIDRVIDETMRWLSPVQSATRHVINPVSLAGVDLLAGDTVNCMLAAANRDPAVFESPDRFDPDRANLGRHLGFATGPHHCIGFRLAKAEARVAIVALLRHSPTLTLDLDACSPPTGFEFRQPRLLSLAPAEKCDAGLSRKIGNWCRRLHGDSTA